jgi:hypothetical protein
MTKASRKSRKPKKMRQTNRVRNSIQNSIMEIDYTPMEPSEVGLYPIDDSNIDTYFRGFHSTLSYGDCAINILQILFKLNSVCANLMRIAYGKIGMSNESLQMCFLYLTKYDHKFIMYGDDANTFINTIKQATHDYRNTAAVIWYADTNPQFGHFQIIARDSFGKYYIIDPQLPEGNRICDLDDTTCLNYLIRDGRKYGILHHSKNVMNKDEMIQRGFIL